MAKAERNVCRTPWPVAQDDILWSVDGLRGDALVGMYASTEHLTAGEVRLAPGGQTGLHVHGGDETLYVLDGVVNVISLTRMGRAVSAGSNSFPGTASTSRKEPGTSSGT